MKTDKQLDFLDKVEPPKDGIPISVCHTDENNWTASIAGGWWIAHGATKEAAVKAVMKRYQDEIERLTI